MDCLTSFGRLQTGDREPLTSARRGFNFLRRQIEPSERLTISRLKWSIWYNEKSADSGYVSGSLDPMYVLCETANFVFLASESFSQSEKQTQIVLEMTYF